jgi:hypothetical protein
MKSKIIKFIQDLADPWYEVGLAIIGLILLVVGYPIIGSVFISPIELALAAIVLVLSVWKWKTSF